MRAKRVLVFFILRQSWPRSSRGPALIRSRPMSSRRRTPLRLRRVAAVRRRLAPPAADADAARRPRSSGLRPAFSRCPSICSRRRTSTRIGRTGSTSATTAATTRASCTRCGIGQRIGPKPPESASWGDCNDDWPRERIVSPYPVQDGEGTLRGAAGAGQGEGRPDRLHEGDRARLGRLLPARRPGRPRLGVDLGRHAGADGPLAAHAGISEAHGADRLPRGGHQRAAVERVVLLARGIHPLVVAALAGGQLPADDDARGTSSSCRASPTTSCAR